MFLTVFGIVCGESVAKLHSGLRHGYVLRIQVPVVGSVAYGPSRSIQDRPIRDVGRARIQLQFVEVLDGPGLVVHPRRRSPSTSKVARAMPLKARG